MLNMKKKLLLIVNNNRSVITKYTQQTPQKRSGHFSWGGGGIENTQTHGAAHSARRERSRHARKGQPSDIHNTGTRGTQHLTESDGR